VVDLSENIDKQKMMETLVNPDVSSILAELEGGEKDSTYLESKLHLSVDQIKDRLSYVIENKFVMVTQNNGKEIFNVDLAKLNKIMENDDNFKNVVDGLTELDQFLN
jgi:glutamate/tyrosine decarboxylase-like PLP-dependent enzyme